jgi:2,3-bisphosphoglycerate-independent phosphoglycerate mutase
LLITADHGNAEQMFDHKTGQPHTAHTSDPVPFIYMGRNALIVNEKGKLSDIAPTMLHLLNLPQPKEMSGQSLVKLV